MGCPGLDAVRLGPRRLAGDHPCICFSGGARHDVHAKSSAHARELSAKGGRKDPSCFPRGRTKRGVELLVSGWGAQRPTGVASAPTTGELSKWCDGDAVDPGPLWSPVCRMGARKRDGGGGRERGVKRERGHSFCLVRHPAFRPPSRRVLEAVLTPVGQKA